MPNRSAPLWLAALLAVAVAFGLAIWLTRPALTGGGPSQFVGAIFVLAFDAVPVSGWMIAAWGFGSLMRRALRVPTAELGSVELAFGVPALLWLDHALGAAGILQLGGGAGAWLLLCAGWLVALISLRERLTDRSFMFQFGRWGVLALLPAVPAATLLLVAATSAPGWLWASEAYGYDVLEYHLQMPREWLELGLLTPLKHNAYSFAPSYVEAAYYHLAVLLDPLATPGADGAVAAATAAQLLHACLMFWAAREVTLLARRFVSNWMAIAAGAIAISVPWVIVAGSMAYNEAPLIGLLAVCWRLVDLGPRAMRWFVLIGFLTGVACGAKLTAVGGVVAPIGALLLVRVEPRRWWRMVAGCALGGLIALAPYLIRNFAALDGANPLFPFLANWLGSAHWSADQVERWNTAHGPHEPLLHRFAALWNMGFMYSQWAGLWFMALAATILAMASSTRRRAAREALVLIAVQLAFWLTLTHLQSRFLLPCLPPLVMLIALALEDATSRLRRPALAIATVLPLVLGLLSVRLYTQQRDGMPSVYIDGITLRTGIAAGPLERQFVEDLARNNSDVFVNVYTPPERGLYLLGDATPFYILRPVTWHTTWDTSPLGAIIRMHGDDQSAWAQALLDQGLPLVLVNYSEIERLARRDEWYDPIFAELDLQAFFDSHAEVVAAWRGGRVLYRVIPPAQ